MTTIFEEKTTTKVNIKSPSKYNVVAYDNDVTSFDEVVFILVGATKMSLTRARDLTVTIDTVGKAKINEEPLTKAIADLQLKALQNVKEGLASKIPYRRDAIMQLKFKVIKE